MISFQNHCLVCQKFLKLPKNKISHLCAEHLENAVSHYNDKSLFKNLVKTNWEALKYATLDVESDDQIYGLAKTACLEDLKKNPHKAEYLSSRLKKDSDIAFLLFNHLPAKSLNPNESVFSTTANKIINTTKKISQLSTLNFIQTIVSKVMMNLEDFSTNEKYNEWLEIAEKHEKSNQIDSAISAYQEALTINPQSKKSIERLVDLFEKKSDWQNLADIIEKLIPLESDQKTKAKLCQKVANIYNHKLKDPIAMVQAYEKGLNAHAESFKEIEISAQKNYLLYSIQEKPNAIQFTAKEIQNDADFNLLLLNKNQKVIAELSEDLAKNRPFMLDVFKLNPDLFFHKKNHFKEDLDFILEIIEEHPSIFAKLPIKLMNDPKFALYAIQKNHDVVDYIEPILKSDRDFMTKIIQINPQFFRHLDSKLKDNTAFILNLIKYDLSLYQYLNKKLQTDPSILAILDSKEDVLKQIKRDPHLLKYASDNLKNNREIVKEAIIRNPKTLEYASHILKDDKAFISEHIKQDGNLLKYLSARLKDDQEIVSLAIQQEPLALQYASTRLKNDFSLVRFTIKKDVTVLAFLDHKFRNNKEISLILNDPTLMFQQINKNPESLKFIGDFLKNNQSLMKTAVKQDGKSLRYANQNLQNLPELALDAIKNNICAFPYLSNSLKTNPMILNFLDHREQITLQMILKQDVEMFQYLSHRLRSDLSFVLDAIELLNGSILEFVDDKLKNNKQVVIQAIKSYPLALKHVPNHFLSQAKIVQEALQQNGLTLEYVSESLKDDPESVAIALKSNGLALAFASKKLQNDEQIVKIAVQQNGLALKFANERLKNNLTIVMDALTNDMSAFEYVSKSLQEDSKVTHLLDRHDFVSHQIKQKPETLAFASDRLKDDFEILKQAITANGNMLQYASNRLKRNEALVFIAIQENPDALKYAIEYLQPLFAIFTKKEITLSTIQSIQNLSDPLYTELSSVILKQHSIIQLLFNYADDIEIMSAFLKKDGSLLEFASPRLKNNQSIVVEAIRQNAKSLRYADLSLQNIDFIKQYFSEDWKQNSKFINDILSVNGLFLEHVFAVFKDDIKIVTTAVQENGLALEFASERLKNQESVVIEAVYQDFRFSVALHQFSSPSLKFASQRIQNIPHSDSNSVLQIVFLQKLKRDLEIATAFMEHRGELLEHSSPQFQDDAHLVMIAVKQNGLALQYASSRLQDDLKIVEQAILKNPEALQFASENIKKNKSFIIKALQQNGKILAYLSDQFRNDIDVVKIAIASDPDVIQYASENVRKKLKLKKRVFYIAMIFTLLASLFFYQDLLNLFDQDRSNHHHSRNQPKPSTANQYTENTTQICSPNQLSLLLKLISCQKNENCQLKDIDDFFSLYENAESKISFFYQNENSSLSSQQWDTKKAEVSSNLTTMSSNYDNTILFATTFISAQKDYQFANQKIDSLLSKVNQSLTSEKQKSSIKLAMKTILPIHKSIDFDHAKAKKISFLKNLDLKFFESTSKKNKEDHDLNQFMLNSTSLFTYPCLSQLCQYAIDQQNISCQDDDTLSTICTETCQIQKSKAVPVNLTSHQAKISDLSEKRDSKPAICSDQEIFKLLYQLRHNKDVSKLNDQILNLFQNSPIKTTFFFKPQQLEIDRVQWNAKKDELLSNLTTMVGYRDNTIALIIANASANSNSDKNRQISTKRVDHIRSKIDELLKSNNETLKCTHMYNMHVSKPLNLDLQWAKDHNYIQINDLIRAKKDKQKPSEYVNQSAIVLTYPCFREWCEFMKEGLELSCEEIADECQEIANCR
jgi:hypothetical protein